ncbi:MAG TPA: SDR family oxidoreductase [Chitinophagaceae bacterium]|nr:SDR family oxidoreductase [Chitinophagaceae bacterium]
MNIALSGKVAVVCGSTQGIGLATAKELALLGATCILLARNNASLEKAINELDTKNGQFHTFETVDFSDTVAVKNGIDTIVAKQPVHILVNNSGGPAAGPILKASSADFLAGMNQHLINNHHLVQTVLPGMQRENYGRIINIISTSVKTPLRNLGVSNTIRLAVAAWAKSVANEIGGYNITINNILPGLTATARLESLIKHTADSQNKTYNDIADQMRNDVPLQRFGTAEEIASVAAFLATPAAAYINGASIPVDGGRTAAL